MFMHVQPRVWKMGTEIEEFVWNIEVSTSLVRQRKIVQHRNYGVQYCAVVALYVQVCFPIDLTQ
jgi:hypothetical protein